MAITIYVTTIPYIENGKPCLFLVVGLPITEGASILPCLRSSEEFLQSPLSQKWGFEQIRNTKLADVKLPEGYRFNYRDYYLNDWNEIPDIVSEELAVLTQVLENFRTLERTRPAVETKFLSLE